jgi:hypothetical protein
MTAMLLSTIVNTQEDTQNWPKNWQTWWETCAVPENIQFSFSCSFFLDSYNAQFNLECMGPFRYIQCHEDKNILYPETNQILTEQTVVSRHSVWHLCHTNRLHSSVGMATGCGLDGPGIESRWEARFSAPVQTAPWAHPASWVVGTGSFPGVKRPGRGVDHPTPSCAEVKEVELYLYSLSGSSWPVTGWPLPLPVPYQQTTHDTILHTNSSLFLFTSLFLSKYP